MFGKDILINEMKEWMNDWWIKDMNMQISE